MKVDPLCCSASALPTDLLLVRITTDQYKKGKEQQGLGSTWHTSSCCGLSCMVAQRNTALRPLLLAWPSSKKHAMKKKSLNLNLILWFTKYFGVLHAYSSISIRLWFSQGIYYSPVLNFSSTFFPLWEKNPFISKLMANTQKIILTEIYFLLHLWYCYSTVSYIFFL